MWLGVKREGETDRIGGGVNPSQRQRAESFCWRLEGAKGGSRVAEGCGGEVLLNTGLPSFHDSTAETAEHQPPRWNNLVAASQGGFRMRLSLALSGSVAIQH